MQILKKGEVLAFQTDTVWGFGANPEDENAIDKIYEIKKREKNKPLILMSNDFKNLEKYIKNIPPYAFDLIEKYLPGGLTLVFEKSSLCSKKITSNLDTVGIRIPDDSDFFELIENLNIKVLATTSCNISNEPPSTDYFEAYKKFSKYATIIKPKKIHKKENTPSTVILCKNENYEVLRKGIVKL